jgi:hypothetical protein
MSWSKEQETTLLELLVATSAFFARELPDISLRMYAKILMEHEPDFVFEAMRNVMRDPKIRQMPTPAQILETVKPVITPTDDARDVAALLGKACRKKGDLWSAGFFQDGRAHFEGGGKMHNTFEEAVIAEVGEVGFEVIRRIGGWGSFYTLWNNTTDSHFMAQMRDLAETVSKKSLGGVLYELPKLRKSQAQIEHERRQLLREQLKQLGPSDDAS